MTDTNRLPVLFFGHGDPRNAIWDNGFTRSLKTLRDSFTVKPEAILVISAHWLSRGTFVSSTANPAMIYDFNGFPPELYQIKYPAPGSPRFAHQIMEMLPEVKEESVRGLDHGAWTLLIHLFPKADIPVLQLSIDFGHTMDYHFNLAKKLRIFRDKGLLIIGSGNIVHNLQYWFSKKDNKPFDWAVEFDEWVKDKLVYKDFESLIHYENAGKSASLSVPTTDHYIPMIYSIALADASDEIQFTYEEVFTSASMRSFRIG